MHLNLALTDKDAGYLSNSLNILGDIYTNKSRGFEDPFPIPVHRLEDGFEGGFLYWRVLQIPIAWIDILTTRIKLYCLGTTQDTIGWFQNLVETRIILNCL